MAKKTEEKDNIGVIDSDSNLEWQRRREAYRKKILWTFFIVILLALVVIVVVVFSKFFFRVRNIEVTSPGRYTNEEILQAGKLEMGEVMFLVDEDAVASSIQKKLPFVISVKIERDYPGTLRIEVKETKADFYFEISGQYVVLSRELKILDVLTDKEKLESTYADLVPVKLPAIQNAVQGNYLQYSDKRDSEFIPKLLYALDVCQMRDAVISIDARVRFDIQINYLDLFTIELGNTSDFETKLIFAKQIIKSFAEGTTGTVNVKDPEKGYALVDKPENLLPK